MIRTKVPARLELAAPTSLNVAGTVTGREMAKKTVNKRKSGAKAAKKTGEKVRRPRRHKNTEESGLTKTRQGAAAQGSGLAMVGAADRSRDPLRGDFLG